MNSEISEKTKAFCLPSLLDHIDDASLDIVTDGGLSSVKFAKLVYTIGNRFRFNPSRKVVDYPIKIGGREYAIRVNNNKNGFVSVTNDDGNTGLSDTVYYPFFKNDDGWLDGFCNLADMISEAWYYSEN